MLKYVASLITSGAKCTPQMKSRVALFTCKLDLNLRKKLVKCYIWNMTLCGAETSTLRKDQKYLKSFDVCCWRRMAISWTDSVKNEEVLQIVKEERDMQHTVKIKES